MVLGDSLNDLSMFRAGFGAAVAMRTPMSRLERCPVS